MYIIIVNKRQYVFMPIDYRSFWFVTYYFDLSDQMSMHIYRCPAECHSSGRSGPFCIILARLASFPDLNKSCTLHTIYIMFPIIRVHLVSFRAKISLLV